MDRTESSTGVIERAMSFPIDHIVERYCAENGVEPERAKEYERELKRFYAVMALHPDRIYGVSEILDPLLHMFIVYTGIVE